MTILLWIGVFLASLAVLVTASDFFTKSAEKIGLSLRIPPFLVGVVIVGFGTSLPELVSSLFAVVAESSEIVIGSVLGSNITNIFLVLGIGAVMKQSFRFQYDIMRIDLPILLAASLLIALMVWDTTFSRGEAVLCLAGLVLYVSNSVQSAKNGESTTESSEKKAGILVWLLLAGSAVFVFLGAKYLVEAVISISRILKIGSEVIALSAVAIGTSLPEVAVAISSARRGKIEMVLGNIIGSNIFNTFAVMGIPALVGTLTIPQGITAFALPVSVVATLLCVMITVDKRITRWEGALLLVFYGFFLMKLFGWI